MLSGAERLCGRTPWQMRQWAIETVSVAVQSGNAEVLAEGHRRSLAMAAGDHHRAHRHGR